MKVCEYPYQNFQFKKTEGTFGLEIETEVLEYSNYPSGLLNPNLMDDGGPNYVEGVGHFDEYKLWGRSWKGVVDHSLRNFGVEYVMKKPHSYEGTLHAINEFCEETSAVPFLTDAPGTSVHVHVNMQSETILTLFTFITTWTLLENVLVEYSGESRRSNLFALPARVATGIIETYCTMAEQVAKGGRNALHVSENNAKYSALNVAPIHRLGSVEIRTLRGTTSKEILTEWVTILNDILIFSRKNKPSDLLRAYHLGGAEEVIERVFSNKSFLSSIDNIPARIDSTLASVYRIVKSADWDQIRDLSFEKSTQEPKSDHWGNGLTLNLDQAHANILAQMAAVDGGAPMFATVTDDDYDFEDHTDYGDDDE